MNKQQLMGMLVILLISLLATEAQAANDLPLTTVLSAIQQQDDNPRPAQLGENRGEIAEGSSEIWTYEGKAGEVLTMKAEADNPADEAEDRTGLLDMMLIVYAPDGVILAKADDIQPGTVTDSVIESLQLPTDGTYQIEVLGLEKQGSGAYTLTLQAGNATQADPTPTPDPDWPTLTIENQLKDTICYVYISSISSDSWGADWLAEKVISPNDSRQWHVEPDTYDILLSDCYGNTLDEIWNFDVPESSTLTVSPSATDEPAAQCAEGVQLALDGRWTEALPQLEAGFAKRKNATFTDPDNEGICALWLGFLRNNFGNRSGGLVAYKVALNIFQTNGNREFEGWALNNIGEIHRVQGENLEALAYYEQALEILRQVGDRAVEGVTLNNIGLIYRAQGKYAQALVFLEQALEILREVEDRTGEGKTLNNIGEIYDNQEKYELALAYYEQALKIRKEVRDQAGEATTLSNIGSTYHNQEKYVQALTYYEQSLQILREVGDWPGEGITLNNIGEVYREQGKYQQALIYYEQSLQILRKVEDRPGEGKTLNNIAELYSAQRKYTQALAYYEQELEVLREMGDRASKGTTLNDIGLIYDNQGKYEQALAHYKQALEIRVEVGDRAGEGTTLNNIGEVYRAQGKYQQALASLQQALEISVEVGNRVSEGTILNNIAGIYLVQEKYAQALARYEQALDIRVEVEDRFGEGTTLHNIAAVYYTQAKYEQALVSYQRALEVIRQVGDRTMEGITLNNIGELYRAQGKYLQALAYYEQAFEIRVEVGDPAGKGRTLNNIGLAYEQKGEASEALAHYEQAMDVFESVRATAGSDQERASFIAQYAFLYDNATGLYYQKEQDEAAFLTSERGRARSFLDSLATGYVQLSDEELQELLKQERDAYDQRFAIRYELAHVRVQNPPDVELVADLEQQLASAEEAHKVALDAIEARGGQLTDLVPGRTKRVSLSEIQADLPENTTLVSYHILGDDDTLAFILTPDELNVVPLGVGSQDLTEQITAFYQIFTDPFFEEKEQETTEKLQQLYESLITPLKPHLNTPGVTIIPHGILHYLPFAALTDGESYFSDQYVLSSLPSASVLPSIQENRKPDTTIESVLALGNPTGDLRFAEQEVAAIADLFGDSVQTLVRADATESAFGASEANVLHVAAHGKYDSDQPLSSVLKLAGDATTDGDLQVSEVYGLKFTNTSLIVLSACETSISSGIRQDESVVTDGDEIVALNRAFLFAGTPTVISTLWGVDDASTGLLMERFYTHLRDGKGKAEALRQAQIDLREEYPHPYYWAGFVLSGDGGEVSRGEILSIVGPYLPCLSALLLLGIVAVAGISRKRLRA